MRGIDVGRTWMRALTISGALAGLGGINFVLGYKHYYEEGFATGAGFLGIAVALVGRSNPLGIVLAALFFATLSQGGLAINALVPKQMVDALQGVVILAMAASVPEVRRLLALHAEARAMSVLLAFLAQTLRIAVPYLFAAAGGVLAERAGIISLTLEGFMLGGAFSAMLGSYYTAARGSACSRRSRAGSRSRLVHAVAHHPLQGGPGGVGHRDQPARGGAHAILSQARLRQLVELPARAGLLGGQRARRRSWPGCCTIHSFRLGLLIVPAVAWLLYRTPFGLRVRAVGEHPEAARHARRLGGARALRRRRALGRARGARRRVSLARPASVHRRHERRPRLHRARGDHLRPVGSDARGARVPLLRRGGDAADPAAGNAGDSRRSSCR